MPRGSAEQRSVLEQAFRKASEAAAPAVCLPPALEGIPRRPALVLGAGKAAASMAAVFHAHWGAPARGMVVTRYGHGLHGGDERLAEGPEIDRRARRNEIAVDDDR